jgi:hypothetical protein
MDIVDASDPANPVDTGHYRPAGSGIIGGVAVADGYAYLTDSSLGLCLVDVLDPAAPAEVGCRATLRAYNGVAVMDGYVHAVGSGGLFILRESFSLTGRVADVNGSPVEGVTVSTNTGLNTITDESGVYTYTNLLHGTYTLTPTLAGYAFWPPTRTDRLGPDAVGQHFTILPEPVSITLTTGTALPPGTASLPARLVYTDTQGLPTRLDFPTGTVTQTTTLVLTPTLAWDVAGYAFAGHAFELAAYRGGRRLPGLNFGAPVTVTIQYSDPDVRVVADESLLDFWWWTGTDWQDGTATCDPASAYARDTASNLLRVPICRLGRFGLFGPTHQAYLPLTFCDRS